MDHILPTANAIINVFGDMLISRFWLCLLPVPFAVVKLIINKE